jgi:maltose/moltooligosaccharide transporter
VGVDDGVPYIMVVSLIPKERYGVYMGIVNMMIVVPMLIETFSFGFIYDHFLHTPPTRWSSRRCCSRSPRSR